MSPENTQRLYARFPTLYRGRHRPLDVSLMSTGFDCGDGWFNLIWHLSASIEDVATQAGIARQSDAWPEVVQVKEKFGSLRFRLRNATEPMHHLIDAAADISERTCEVCGQGCVPAPGKPPLCLRHQEGGDENSAHDQ